MNAQIDQIDLNILLYQAFGWSEILPFSHAELLSRLLVLIMSSVHQDVCLCWGWGRGECGMVWYDVMWYECVFLFLGVGVRGWFEGGLVGMV